MTQLKITLHDSYRAEEYDTGAVIWW